MWLQKNQTEETQVVIFFHGRRYNNRYSLSVFRFSHLWIDELYYIRSLVNFSGPKIFEIPMEDLYALLFSPALFAS